LRQAEVDNEQFTKRGKRKSWGSGAIGIPTQAVLEGQPIAGRMRAP